MTKGLKPVGTIIHRSSPKGPNVASMQGGVQYKSPKVVSGSLRSATPGHGEGRGSPHKGKR